jgi:hypothetical protein
MGKATIFVSIVDPCVMTLIDAGVDDRCHPTLVLLFPRSVSGYVFSPARHSISPVPASSSRHPTSSPPTSAQRHEGHGARRRYGTGKAHDQCVGNDGGCGVGEDMGRHGRGSLRVGIRTLVRRKARWCRRDVVVITIIARGPAESQDWVAGAKRHHTILDT